MAVSRRSIKHALYVAVVLGALKGVAHAQGDADLPSCGAGTEALSRFQQTSVIGRRLDSVPAADRPASAEVGQSLASSQSLLVFGAVMEVAGPFNISGKLGPNKFTLAVPAEPLVQLPSRPGLIAPNSDFRYERDKGPRTFGKPTIYFNVMSGTTLSASFNYGIGSATFEVPDARITLKKCEGDPVPEFRQELIYSGVAKGVISLTYREFSKDLVRPAFTQNLTYDLADGREIGFRGARIRIDEATNTVVRYTVLKPLGGGQ